MGGLHVVDNCRTLDRPVASVSSCHLGLWRGWQILLNPVKLCLLDFLALQ